MHFLHILGILFLHSHSFNHSYILYYLLCYLFLFLFIPYIFHSILKMWNRLLLPISRHNLENRRLRHPFSSRRGWKPRVINCCTKHRRPRMHRNRIDASPRVILVHISRQLANISKTGSRNARLSSPVRRILLRENVSATHFTSAIFKHPSSDCK